MPGVGLLTAGDEFEEGGLADAVAADDPDDGAGWDRKAQIVEEQSVAVAFREPLGLDHDIAESRAVGDEDLEIARQSFGLLGEQFLVGIDPRLALGMAGTRRHLNPLEFACEGLLPFALAAFLLAEALFLLLEPGRVVALPRDSVAAVEFEDPAGDVVEEVAVVGHRDDGALIVLEMALEPSHREGVEVIGGLVEEQDVGLLDQQPAQGDPASFTA